MKAIIILPCSSKDAPGKQGEFYWNEKHNAHIWDNRELEPEEFNAVIDRIMADENYYHRPTVRILVVKKKK